VRAGRRTVEVHRPDKVLFPGGGAGKEYTKADLVDYYRAVAPFMLPHLRGRPLMLERYPDGVGGPTFMQKNTPDGYPDWISRVEVSKEGGTVRHTVCDDTASPTRPVSLCTGGCPASDASTTRTGWSSTSTPSATTSPRCTRRPGCWRSCSTN
jgi:hypothetical protein